MKTFSTIYNLLLFTSIIITSASYSSESKFYKDFCDIPVQEIPRSYEASDEFKKGAIIIFLGSPEEAKNALIIEQKWRVSVNDDSTNQEMDTKSKHRTIAEWLVNNSSFKAMNTTCQDITRHCYDTVLMNSWSRGNYFIPKEFLFEGGLYYHTKALLRAGITGNVPPERLDRHIGNLNKCSMIIEEKENYHNKITGSFGDKKDYHDKIANSFSAIADNARNGKETWLINKTMTRDDFIKGVNDTFPDEEYASKLREYYEKNGKENKDGEEKKVNLYEDLKAACSTIPAHEGFEASAAAFAHFAFLRARKNTGKTQMIESDKKEIKRSIPAGLHSSHTAVNFLQQRTHRMHFDLYPAPLSSTHDFDKVPLDKEVNETLQLILKGKEECKKDALKLFNSVKNKFKNQEAISSASSILEDQKSPVDDH